MYNRWNAEKDEAIRWITLCIEEDNVPAKFDDSDNLIYIEHKEKNDNE